jgi:hypothetical protein
MLTLFTVPKPFVGHIDVIQRNAIRSWLSLGQQVEILLLGNEIGLSEAASEFGITSLPVTEVAPSGVPLVSAVFDTARRHSSHRLLCYLNADIILLDDFLPAVEQVCNKMDRFLIVGSRWDLAVDQPLEFTAGWTSRMRDRLSMHGKRHKPAGSDYFVFTAGQYHAMPAFAIGRAGWDNWMIYQARRERTPVIDASGAITIVHQAHDYAHLPNGQRHYRHPESLRNIALAGGTEAIFKLEDADWRLTSGGPVRKGAREYRWPRKAEADILARVVPGILAQLTRLAFHPFKTLKYFLGERDSRPPGTGRDSAAGRSKD